MSIRTYRLHFSSLGLSIIAEFVLDGIPEEIIQGAWSHNIFARNLPPFQATPTAQRDRPDFAAYIARQSSKRFHVRWSLKNQTLAYSTESSELPEDLEKIVLQTLAAKAPLRRFALFHASALITEQGAILIPGASGTGKSTMALWWLASGRPVAASDTTVVSAAGVHGGNSCLSIKHTTARHYLGSRLPETERQSGEYLLFHSPASHRLPLPVQATVFIKLTEPESSVREIPISFRRASMKLYEDAHWIAAGGFLLGGQYHPALPAVEYRSVKMVARIARKLAAGRLHWLEGGAATIGEWLSQRF
jgi:hypothetical protein